MDFQANTLLSTAAGEKAERSALPGGGLGEIGRQIWAVLSIPTFLIIVLQVLPLAACSPQLWSLFPAQRIYQAPIGAGAVVIQLRCNHCQ